MDAETRNRVEQGMLDLLRRHLGDGLSWAVSGPPKKWLLDPEVRLEGSYPDTYLVAVFRLAQNPEARYGWARQIWMEDADPESEWDLVGMWFDDAVSPTFRYRDEVGRDGVIWINGPPPS